MPLYECEVEWSAYGVVFVEAGTKDEAKEIAQEAADIRDADTVDMSLAACEISKAPTGWPIYHPDGVTTFQAAS